MKQEQPCMEPKAGYLSRYRFVAKNWEQPASYFQAWGINPKNVYKIRQELKTSYLEILKRVNPSVLSA